ncbi:MAG: deoxyribodipyrimidine photo-lyase, partial [Marinovum sp.]|nr:deoxyribodipyrimidine photo-lyase [Marinovum sp.]
MSDAPPILLWLRRDFRLSDHPALSAAVASGRPIVPVFIRDSEVDALGAAPKWRLGLGLAQHKKALTNCGSRLVLRTGAPLACLQRLIEETGATAVYWSRLYDPSSIARDQEVKETLKSRSIEARSFGGHLLFEPWCVETKTGGFYRVYSPMWRAVKDREVAAPLAAPVRIAPPKNWPQSERIEDWSLDAAMARGAAIVRPYVR